MGEGSREQHWTHWQGHRKVPLAGQDRLGGARWGDVTTAGPPSRWDREYLYRPLSRVPRVGVWLGTSVCLAPPLTVCVRVFFSLMLFVFLGVSHVHGLVWGLFLRPRLSLFLFVFSGNRQNEDPQGSYKPPRHQRLSWSPPHRRGFSSHWYHFLLKQHLPEAANPKYWKDQGSDLLLTEKQKLSEVSFL